jgi:aromatase
MTVSAIRHVRHEARVSGPADFLYGLVADATAAPWVFPATVHVQILDQNLEVTPTRERLRIWAADNGSMRTWTSRRQLDRAARQVTFEQEIPAAPIAFMRGQWSVEAVDGTSSQVTLTHDFSAVDTAALSGIEAMVDRISNGQLDALASFAALGGRESRGPISFTDAAEPACRPEVAYAFVHDVLAGTQQLSGQQRTEVREFGGGMQLVEVSPSDGRADSGSHTAQICFPGSRIAFKKLTLPPLVASHTGSWQFTTVGDSCRVEVRQVIAPRFVALAAELGPDVSDEAARTHLRRALGGSAREILSRLVAAHGQQLTSRG